MADVDRAAEPLTGRFRLHRRIYAWVLHWAGHRHARLALFGLAFAEASFFPVPPDVLLMAMAVAQPRRARRFALLCTVGSVLGGLTGYAIGWGVWHMIDAWVFDHLGAIGFTHANFDTVQRAYAANAFSALFLAGFTPIPYKVFTISAGVFAVGLPVFVLASTIGRAGRFFLVAELVARIGPRVQPFVERYLGWLTLAFGVLLVLGFYVVKML